MLAVVISGGALYGGSEQSRAVCTLSNFGPRTINVTQALLRKKGGGRAAAVEIMTGTVAVRNLIREGKIHQLPGTMQVSQKDGMQTMDMALMELVARGLVTKEEAQSRSMTPNLFGGGAFGVAGPAGRGH